MTKVLTMARLTLRDFEARKEAEAAAATLEPWVTVERHDAGEMLRVGNAWTRALFDGDFFLSPLSPGDLPSTSLVFVQSRDGNTVAKNPSLLGGGETDKHLVYEGLSRVAADAVLAGAETIRDGRIVLSVWHPQLVDLRGSLGLPRHPVQIVATLRGVQFDEGVLFNEPDLRVILLTVPACSLVMHHALAQRPWITPVIMKNARVLAEAFRQLRRLGIQRISCIGGRTLAGQLIDAGLVDDLYLTTSAREGGEPNTPLYGKPIDGRIVVRKRGTGADAGVTFEHKSFGHKADHRQSAFSDRVF